MNEYYKKMLEIGLEYQDFVVERLYDVGLPLISYSSKKFQHLIGENKAGFEIKKDQKFRDTNNFYIEIAEKSDPNNFEYIQSGIYRNDNTWLWIQGDEKNIYVFSKKQLIILHKSKRYKEIKTATSIGFLLPFQEALKNYVIKEIICK